MKTFSFALLVVTLLVSCKQPNSGHPQSADPGRAVNHDSVAIVTLLKSVYKWHNENGSKLVDFDVIISDSFQTGLNYDSFNKTFKALKQTGYFSSSFIDNYKKIADSVNYKLTTANPKMLNEINFSFQDADPWTGFQDDFPDFWNHFIITDYKSTTGSVSLKWKAKTNDWTSPPYNAAFSKENGQWKVSYLEGFDINHI
jgi:hypothetical protein